MFGSSYDVNEHGEKYQNEQTKFMPNSPYAISKCAAHHCVRIFRDAYAFHASSGILFNHEGPRRGDNFVTQKIIKWIKEFKNHYKSKDFPKLRLGNLDAHRDWGYAGDYVQAMWMMLQQDIPDDYVICTGETHTIRDFLDLAFKHIDIDNWEDYVVIDPEFYRPCEVDYLRGDCSKARNKLGWKHKVNLEGLVKLMLNA